MGTIKRHIQEMHFRMNLRKNLQNETIELLRITLEETQKEINRRNKKQ